MRVVDDVVRTAAGGADADVGGGGVAARPVELPVPHPEAFGLHQLGRPFLQILAQEEAVVGGEGQLVGGAADVGAEHLGVGRIDDRRFGRPVEQLFGVGHEVLIEGVLAAHQHRQRLLDAAPGPAGLLPERGDGPRVGGEHGRVEAADVDAELEGVGRHHPPELAGEEIGLDLAAFLRQVAAPVGGDGFGDLL